MLELDDQEQVMDYQMPVCSVSEFLEQNKENLAKHLQDKQPDLHKEFKVCLFRLIR